MRLLVGKVLKAHGIKGEVKISCLLDNAEMLRNAKQLYIGSQTYAVDSFRADGAFCYVKFAGHDDRNFAESLKNWDVYAEKEDVLVPSGRYFVQDLIGCRVSLDSGEDIGCICDVLQYGAADVFECVKYGRKVSFPFLKDLTLSVDVLSKRIVLSAKRFAEVALYED